MNKSQRNFLMINVLFMFGLLLGYFAQAMLYLFIYAGVFAWALLVLKMMEVRKHG